VGTPVRLKTLPAPRIVFDTNIVVSALVFAQRLRAAWASRRAGPIACRETITELQRVLLYPKFRLTPADREILLGDYLPYIEIVRLPVPLAPLPLACRDRNDIVFIHLALAGGADFLVSGDKDIASLRATAPISILSPAELRPIVGPAHSTPL
jgi:putative PIN family toxin of toxin-antitoxin system